LTSQDEHEGSWYLGSMPASPPPPGQWTLRFGEAISGDEYASHKASAGLISETISSSSFAELQRRYNRFKAVLSQVASAFAIRQVTPEMTQSIGGELDDVLTALRRFADRTAHALSQRYGKESQEYVTFTRALSYEFDNEFAYRFAWHLRRYSDHRGSIPFQIREESRPGSNETVDRQFWVVLDSRTLLENHDWHSLVRPDLERINGEFPIEPVIDGLHFSCSRAYCKTLLAQEPLIMAAIANIRNFATRAAPTNDVVPIFIRSPSTGISPMTITSVSIELADVAESALRQARVITA